MANTIKLIGDNKPLMIAHRGASGLEPENTHAAFIAAGNRSYYGIETDIHKTADGYYVIMHDASTLRMTGDDLLIGQATYQTLRSMQIKEKNGNKNRSDLRIPNLEEYIGICRHYEKIAVLELKDDFTAEDIDEICSAVEKFGYMSQTVFISFKFQNLVLLRERCPDQAAQFLIREFEDGLIARLSEYKLDLDIKHTALTEENIKACHDAGIKVNCWTVDDPQDAYRLIGYGVDYITTNILE